MNLSMEDAFWAFVVLSLLLIVSEYVRQRVRWIKRIFLPASIIAGVAALLLGPQVLGALVTRFGGEEAAFSNGLWPEPMVAVWTALPGLLISVVFAALLMGKTIPPLRKIWLHAGPQVCFGQTVAWGQYVIGLLLAILVLGPLFGIPAIAGALIEIGFEGGHGTAAGMREAFAEAGWEEGADLALGLATFGLVAGVLIGTVLINWAVLRGHIPVPEAGSMDDVKLVREDVTDAEIAELKRDKVRDAQPTDSLSLHLGLVGVAITLGWLLLEALRWIEAVTWGRPDEAGEAVRVLTHVPLFPMAMIGGVTLQVIFQKLGRADLISGRLMRRISGSALDFTIIAALGSLSLLAIGQNWGPFLILAVAGMLWSVFAVLVIAPRIIPEGWFERGVGDFGQSMGVTVTGLLLMRVADPPNRAGALESFGYKQLLFEPIVGGGLFTGASVGLIAALGPGAVLVITFLAMVFWLVFGLSVFGRRARQNRSAEAADREARRQALERVVRGKR